MFTIFIICSFFLGAFNNYGPTLWYFSSINLVYNYIHKITILCKKLIMVITHQYIYFLMGSSPILDGWVGSCRFYSEWIVWNENTFKYFLILLRINKDTSLPSIHQICIIHPRAMEAILPPHLPAIHPLPSLILVREVTHTHTHIHIYSLTQTDTVNHQPAVQRGRRDPTHTHSHMNHVVPAAHRE